MSFEKRVQTKKRKGSWLPVLIIFVLIIVLSKACMLKKEQLELTKKNALKKEAPAINVVAIDMKPQIIKDRLNLPGYLEPDINLVVSTEVAGQVLDKSLAEGVFVDQGTLLAVIDSSKYQNAYNAAKASYETALSSKNRLEKLYKSDLTSRSDLDTVTAQMENSQSAMKIAAIDLEKCRVKAPVSGIVNRVYVEEGQFMDIGKPIAEIIRINPIKVIVGIPESDVNAVKNITHYNVTVDALGGKVFTATKSHLTRTTSSLARVYDLELSIDNSGSELLPDMFVRVEVVKRTVDNALAVPLYSVITMENRQIVYLAGENPKHDIIQAAFDALGMNLKVPLDTAFAREVSTGIQDGWMVEITEGIQAGDQVITVGQRSVADGQKIHIIRSHAEQEELVR